MNTIVILCICAVAVFSVPIEDSPTRSLPAVEQIHETDELGQYTIKYITAEGTIVSERGILVPTPDGKDQVLVYEGEFTFIGDDGKTYVTKYKTTIPGAYEVKGDHLPKPVEPELLAEMPMEEIMIAVA